ncbi:hypothetical protein NC652_039616 [Populus alba x Populus x berolinensis]|nr:hypothetical protein NC652_039616 [Populus alba x Populus x berolinensis]
MEMVEVDDGEDVMTTEKMAETAIKNSSSSSSTSTSEKSLLLMTDRKTKTATTCVTRKYLALLRKRFHQTPPRVFQHRMRLQMPAFSSHRSQKTIDVHHASSLPIWADPTRIPDDPTHVPDPDSDDVIIASACTVGMPCQRQLADTSAKWDPHATSSAARRAGLLRAERSRAASRWIGFCAAESMCNWI